MVATNDVAKPGPTQASSQVTLIGIGLFKKFIIPYMLKETASHYLFFGPLHRYPTGVKTRYPFIRGRHLFS